MTKEILLYSAIYDFTAETFIEKLDAAKDSDITLRINTPGGDVQAGFGMIAKFAEHKGVKTIKVDGKANSMGAFFLAYADKVEVLDVSEIVLHRAAYPSWVEAREDFKDSPAFDAVVKINNDLRKGLEAKIDVDAIEKATKTSMDEMFSMESRIDVSLTPVQAKKIGLVSKINKLTSEMSAEIRGNSFAIAAEFGVDVKELQEIKADKVLPVIEDKPNNNNNMTIEDLKANHSGVYNQIFALGSAAGIAAEIDRVAAWLTFVDVDADAVSKGIKEGNNLSQAATAELSRKQFSNEVLATTEADSAPVVEPEKVVVTEGKTSAGETELDALINADKIS